MDEEDYSYHDKDEESSYRQIVDNPLDAADPWPPDIVDERHDRYKELLNDLERADSELGLDLWLIAERIMLHRLTRAGGLKRVELTILVHAIKNIISEIEGPTAIPGEILDLDRSANHEFRGENEANLTQAFTVVVDVAERMNSEELYRLISHLRKAEGPKQEPIDIAPLERAREILSSSSYDEEETEWPI